MTRRAVMFDLDGTLADTLADIAASVNHALQAVGRPAHPVEEYRYLAGQGVDYLIAHALGPDHLAHAARCKALYLAHYKVHKYDRSRPFPGIAELLDSLTQRGIRLATLSNKHDSAVQDVMRTMFGRWRFDAIRGVRDGVPPKPDPTAAIAITEELNIPAAQWVYLGDTAADMLTGRAAGFFTVGAAWGWRDEAELREHGADAIIDEPSKLLDHL